MATLRRRPSRSGLNVLAAGLALPIVVPLGVLGLFELGALGALLLVAATTACSLTGFAACWTADVRRWPGMGPVVATGVAAGLVMLVLVGWLGLEEPLAPVSAALALAATPTVASARHHVLRARTPVGPTDGELAALVVALPTDMLLAEWATTGVELTLRPGLARECALVRLRRVLLDELGTRDPEAFATWQREAGRRQCSPAEFLGPQRQDPPPPGTLPPRAGRG